MEIRLMFAVLLLAAFGAMGWSGGAPAPDVPATTAATRMGQPRRDAGPVPEDARVRAMLRRLDRQLARPVPADMSRRQMRRRMRTLRRQLQQLRVLLRRPAGRQPAARSTAAAG